MRKIFTGRVHIQKYLFHSRHLEGKTRQRERERKEEEGERGFQGTFLFLSFSEINLEGILNNCSNNYRIKQLFTRDYNRANHLLLTY